MEPQSIDKMNELILASLQELCVPPGSTSGIDFTKQPAPKRTHKKHGSASVKRTVCQVAGCEHPLVTAYAKKYRVCNVHVKSPEVHMNDDIQRFCQKCSRFHPVAVFDGERRTCRVRLAQHNTRRRLIRAMQRADREASPTHSSGKNVEVQNRYPLRTFQQAPHYHQPMPPAAAPHHFAPQQLASRPVAGASSMHAALLEVALARLEESDATGAGNCGDSGGVDHSFKQPAVYDTYSVQPPSAPLSSVCPAGYRPPPPPPPPPPPLAPAVPSPEYHHNQLLQQVWLASTNGAAAGAEAVAVLNSLDPQQLMHVLQLIISLQQLGCSYDELEHPEVLPLMISLLQSA